jgi:hypothetical protein
MSTQKKGAFISVSTASDEPAIEIDSISAHPAYSCPLTMYKIPPTDSISLPEFERFACDRMKGRLSLPSLFFLFVILGMRYVWFFWCCSFSLLWRCEIMISQSHFFCSFLWFGGGFM